MVKLDNGLEYLFVENNSSISVVFVLFNVGSRDEVGPVSAGISHFLEHVLFLGNKVYKTNNDIYGKVDDIGGIINGMTHQYMTGYYIKVSNNYIDEAIELLASLVQTPKFDRHNIEKERNVVIEEINAMRNKPIKTAKELFDINLFKGNPLSNSVGGDEKSLGKIDKEMMMDYYNKFYCPSNCAVVYVGSKTVLKKISACFGEWNAKCQDNSIILKRPMGGCKTNVGLRIVTEKRDIAQDSLIIGFPLFGYNDSRRVTAEILNVIIAGMLTSRLFTRLRHKERLVYSVNSMTQFFKSCGYLMIVTSADASAVGAVINGIFDELGALRAQLVLEDELEKVKRNINGVMDIKNENTLNLARFYAECLLNCDIGLPMETVSGYLKKVNMVNNEDLLALAQKYITVDNCLIVCIGKTSSKELNNAIGT